MKATTLDALKTIRITRYRECDELGRFKLSRNDKENVDKNKT